MTMKLLTIFITILACEASRAGDKKSLSSHCDDYIQKRKRVFRVNPEFGHINEKNERESAVMRQTAKQIRATKSDEEINFVSCEKSPGWSSRPVMPHQSAVFDEFIERRKNVFRVDPEELTNLHWRGGSQTLKDRRM
mmetsp:Transcript_47114/g.91941  ORF Transcript_47114/g.91941 Transcript_47114/m.91941 type:complete len:137 (+) Transcript_47114:197-607(+)